MTGIWVLTLKFSSCVTLSQLFHFSVPEIFIWKLESKREFPQVGRANVKVIFKNVACYANTCYYSRPLAVISEF